MTDPAGPSPPEPRPGRRRRRLLRRLALGMSITLLMAAGAGWWLYHRLDSNIRTDTATAEVLHRYRKERPAPVVHEAKNILLIGSDTRSDENGAYGSDEGTERSDTTVLLHLSADRTEATAMSIPRDLMVEIPSCPRPEGGRSEAQLAQFNWAFQFGGAACTIRTVERLTDIRIDHHLIVDFTGFKSVVDAVGGVQVCLDRPVHDELARLDLPAGPQTLNGEEALGYVRTRHGIGDGSDTQRMERQQDFLGALVHHVRDNDVLRNPVTLYPVLDAVTSSLTADAGLDSLEELYELVRSLGDIPEERVHFLTVPRQPYALDPNRDELLQPDADRLFGTLRLDRPVEIRDRRDREHQPDEEHQPGKEEKPDEEEKPGNATATGRPGGEGFRGTTAASDICR